MSTHSSNVWFNCMRTRCGEYFVCNLCGVGLGKQSQVQTWNVVPVYPGEFPSHLKIHEAKTRIANAYEGSIAATNNVPGNIVKGKDWLFTQKLFQRRREQEG